MVEYLELDLAETQQIYQAVQLMKLKPVDIEYQEKCSTLVFVIDNQHYGLVYDRECDWFLDIAYKITDWG